MVCGSNLEKTLPHSYSLRRQAGSQPGSQAASVKKANLIVDTSRRRRRRRPLLLGRWWEINPAVPLLLLLLLLDAADADEHTHPQCVHSSSTVQ